MELDVPKRTPPPDLVMYQRKQNNMDGKLVIKSWAQEKIFEPESSILMCLQFNVILDSNEDEDEISLSVPPGKPSDVNFCSCKFCHFF